MTSMPSFKAIVLPAPATVEACCQADADAKATTGQGCGCGSAKTNDPAHGKVTECVGCC